jgi:hypothetical protein
VPSDKVRSWFRQPAVIAFAIGFCACLSVALVEGEKPFYYDSGTYWALADSFARDGSFSLLDFENNGLRGYGLPLVYFVLQQLSFLNDSHTVMVFNSAVFAAIAAVLVPRLARASWPRNEWTVLRRLALCGVLLVFWRGYLSFPLSDFPALALALLALVAVVSARSPAWMFVAGLAAGLALDFRPAYVMLIPILLVLATWSWLEVRRRGGALPRGRMAAALGAFALAFALVSLPQSLSNHEHLGTYSPVPGGSGLVDLQYTEGLRLQRYDTYVGGTVETARMEYLDPATEAIVEDLPGGTVEGTGGYARLVLEHPVTMAGVFLRHVVNGLDQRYPSGYVEETQDAGNRIWRFAGFMIVFLALVRVLWAPARRRLGEARWRYPAAWLLCGSSAIASAVETRFLLPSFVLATAVVLAPGGWPSPVGPREAGARRLLPAAAIAIAGVAFYALVWIIVGGATDHVSFQSGI